MRLTRGLRRSLPWALCLLCSLSFAAPGAAQFLDPDSCWTCPDSREHFAAGAALDLAARVPFRKAWQRVTATAVIGAVWEAAQWDAARGTDNAGKPGYGFSLKDLACDVAGALAVEGVALILKKVRG